MADEVEERKVEADSQRIIPNLLQTLDSMYKDKIVYRACLFCLQPEAETSFGVQCSCIILCAQTKCQKQAARYSHCPACGKPVEHIQNISELVFTPADSFLFDNSDEGAKKLALKVEHVTAVAQTCLWMDYNINRDVCREIWLMPRDPEEKAQWDKQGKVSTERLELNWNGSGYYYNHFGDKWELERQGLLFWGRLDIYNQEILLRWCKLHVPKEIALDNLDWHIFKSSVDFFYSRLRNKPEQEWLWKTNVNDRATMLDKYNHKKKIVA